MYSRYTTFTSMDFGLITEDKFANQICSTLSAFASRARYFNLDAVLGVYQDFDSKKAWERIEFTIGSEIYGENHFYELLSDLKQIDIIYTETNQEIVRRLEMFFRALTRQFIFGDFSIESKTFIFQIETFTDIDDNQLGKTDYREFAIYERTNKKKRRKE